MPKPLFPVLKLPNVVIDQLVKHWDMENVIDATMRSDKFFGEVEKFKIVIKSLTWLVGETLVGIDLDLGSCIVQIRFVKMAETTGVKKVDGVYVYSTKGPRIPNANKEDHILWTFNVDQNKLEDKLVRAEQVTKHLLKILKPEEFHFQCGLNNATILPDLFIWNHRKNFSTILVKRSDRRSTTMSPEALIFLMEELKADYRDLKIRMNAFQYYKPIQAKTLTLEDMSWVTTICLMGPQLVKARSVGRSTAHIDFNEIITNWVNGGSPNLERLVLDTSTLGLDAAAVYKDLKMEPSIFTKCDMTRRLCDFTEDCQDVRRLSDGRLATLHSNVDRKLEMTVWHKKHLMFLSPATYYKLKSTHGGYFPKK
ncbi:hypothetical protein B9Z55_026384 [Caenorhabditis nigoni]|uniref:F-box domain-containing protein n=1 Tax=Caenorhabditis nigoni TaxID=1611254 RepID=A0A2G5T3E6_9PELO|nr:hypothetical protein B9Z55_026384 [Caenorhabditis nigoni]